MNLKSRKLIIAAIAAVGIVINDLCGRPVSDETIYAVLGILGTYILGQGIADAGAAKAAIADGVKVGEAVNALQKVYEMSIESLCPESFAGIETGLAELAQTRKLEWDLVSAAKAPAQKLEALIDDASKNTAKIAKKEKPNAE